MDYKKTRKKAKAVGHEQSKDLIGEKASKQDTSAEKIDESNSSKPTKSTTALQAITLNNLKDSVSLKEKHKTKTSLPSNLEINDEEYFQQLKKTYLAKMTRDLPAGRMRSDLVIRYYKEASDGDRVYELRKLKYYIHERSANNDKMDSMTSNALYYGDNIKLEDIKIVAYTLIRNGISIKTIEPSQYHNDWKANALEIGVAPELNSKKSLTLREVRSFEKSW